jgi:exosome complex component CSL4
MTASESSRLVLPGELLGTAEEFVPGHGTYEDNGKIYAALLGTRHIGHDRAIRVEAANGVPHLAEGDEVYARVDDVKSAMVVATVLSLVTGRRGIPGTPEGTVHISKAKEEYTASLSDEFSSGDLILAKVLQVDPTIKLSTALPTLGVVSARCQVCHALLTLGPKEAHCPRCGHRESRKFAKEHRHHGAGHSAPASPAPSHGPDAPDS